MLPRKPRSKDESKQIVQHDMTGFVKQFDDDRHFGYIKVNKAYRRVFFHISDVLFRPVEVRQAVTFDLYEGPKGYFAKFVESSKQSYKIKMEDSDSSGDTEDELIKRGATGTVKKFNDDKKFGFIRVNDRYNHVFFHSSEAVVQSAIKAQDEVVFDLYKGSKGHYGKSVRVVGHSKANSLSRYSDNESLEEYPDSYGATGYYGYDHDDVEPRTGVVTQYRSDRGFGFIDVTSMNERVFFHKSKAYKHIQNGDEVSFYLNRGSRGYYAHSVEFLNHSGSVACHYHDYGESWISYEMDEETRTSDSDHNVQDRVDRVERESVRGIVTQYKDERGFGFIEVKSMKDRVFFHKSQLSHRSVENGDEVTFDLYKGSKGYYAQFVKKSSSHASGSLDLDEIQSPYDDGWYY